MKILLAVGLVVAALAFVGYVLFSGDTARYTTKQLSGPLPMLGAPRPENFPTINVAEIVGWKDGETPTPAKGLIVGRFATGLDHPRSMLVLENGDILVAETNSPPRTNKGIEGWVMRNLLDRAGAGSPSANRISLLRDKDGDGTAETSTVLLEGLNSPFGMAYANGTLYVANTDAVLAFDFTPGQDKITGKGRKIVDLNAQQPNNHWTRNIILNADATKLYVAVGSNSNIGENGLETENERAAILEVDLKTGEKIVYATGLRNPVGLDFNPVTGRLWTVVNERDMLGSDLVPDYLAEVQFAENFGWPNFYWGGIEDRRVEPRRYELKDYIHRPDYGLGAHVAALGLVFAEGAKLGKPYDRGAFIARHGSWNRQPAAGYDVVFVRFDGRGYPAVKYNEDETKVLSGFPLPVLTGFLDEDGNAKGRPTQVAIDRRGGLLVTDDTAGIIWRVTAKDPPLEKKAAAGGTKAAGTKSGPA